MGNNFVILEFDDIRWTPSVSVVEDGGETVIKCEYGWTAGLPESIVKDLAEDCPTENRAFFMGLDQAEEFVAELQKAIAAVRQQEKPRENG